MASNDAASHIADVIATIVADDHSAYPHT